MVFPTFLPCEVAGWCGGCLKCILLHIFNIIFIFLLSFLCRYERRGIYFVDFFFLSQKALAHAHLIISAHVYFQSEFLVTVGRNRREWECASTFCLNFLVLWCLIVFFHKTMKFFKGNKKKSLWMEVCIDWMARWEGWAKKKRRNLHTCKLNAWIMHATWAS